jgi:IclR family acetate operon transcriptional repressor
VDPIALSREMARIRADGYARDMEESEMGVRCVAAAVFFGGSNPLAAVSVSAPRERFPAARIREVVEALRRETSPPGLGAASLA